MRYINIIIVSVILLLTLSACSNHALNASTNHPQSTSPHTSATLHTHHFTSTAVRPTCTSAGYTLHKCSCGAEYKEDFIDATNHNWKNATCSNPETCTTCGSTKGNPIGHCWVDATCSSPKTCSTCYAIEGNPLGHKWEAATCTDPKYCSLCGKPEGDALGHSYVDGHCSKCKESDPSQAIKEIEKNASISSTILYDKNNIRIIATELIYGYSEVQIKLSFENYTSSDLSFVSGSLGYCSNSINGFMMYSGYENIDVAAGNQAHGSISFDYSELLLSGIYAVADIELDFHIYDDNYTIEIKTGPMAFKTSISSQYNYDPECYQKAINSIGLQYHLGYTVLYFNAEKIYEKNNVSVISVCMMKNKNGETALSLEVVNNSNQQLQVEINDIALNGLNLQWGTWSTDTINPGKHCIISISLSDVLDEEFASILDMANIATIGFAVAQEDMSYSSLVDEQRVLISIPGMVATFNTIGTEVYNKNGIRIISKGLVLEDSSFSSDIFLILLVQNNSETTIKIDDEYKSFSVNNTMSTLYSCSSVEIPNGEWGLMRITLWNSSLENLGIKNLQDISIIEITLKFRENYTTIDISKIRFEFPSN